MQPCATDDLTLPPLATDYLYELAYLDNPFSPKSANLPSPCGPLPLTGLTQERRYTAASHAIAQHSTAPRSRTLFHPSCKHEDETRVACVLPVRVHIMMGGSRRSIRPPDPHSRRPRVASQACRHADRKEAMPCLKGSTCGDRVGHPLPRRPSSRRHLAHLQSSIHQKCSFIAPRRRRVPTEPSSTCTDGPSVGWVHAPRFLLATRTCTCTSARHHPFTFPLPPCLSASLPPPRPHTHTLCVRAGRRAEFLVQWFEVQHPHGEATASVRLHSKCLETLRPVDLEKKDAKYRLIDPPPPWAGSVPLTIDA